MSFSFINIIESTLSIAIFYIFYKAVLKKETFFNLNRIYLLSSLLFSISIPFFDINVGIFSFLFPSESHMLSSVSGLRQGYYELNAAIIYAYSGKFDWLSIFNYLSIVYLLGVFISTLFFIVGLGNIITLILKGKKEKIGKYTIIKTSKLIVPFSLFKWIIINPEDYSTNDVQQIIAHEKMHAFQLHSFDLIFIEVLVILLWFNPFIYWYRKSIREVHEYLADQAVVENGFDRKEYQKLLFNQVSGNRLIGLTNSFSYSLSKNRLKMLTMMKSKNVSKTKIALAIPFIAAFVFFFTNSTDLVKASETKNIAAEDTTKIIAENGEEIFYTVEIMPKFQGKNPDEFRFYIQKNLKYPEIAQKNGIKGRVFVQFNIGPTGEIKDVEVIRGVDPSLDAEALRVVKSSPKWEPGFQGGKAVTVQFTFPIVFSLK